MNRRNLPATFADFANRGPNDDKGTPSPGGGGGDGGGFDEDKLNRVINAAVSSQLGRRLESALAPLAEQIAGLASAQAKPEAKPEAKPSAESGDIAELRETVANLTKAIAAKDQAAEEKDRQHREDQLISQIRDGLVQSGVKKELLPGAVATFRSKLKVDENGKPTYIKRDNGYDEHLDLSGGLKDWTESDTGKAHLAPVQSGGAGTSVPNAGVRNATVINPATLPQDPEARAKVLKNHRIAEAKKDLRKNVGELMGGGRIRLSGGTE
jgi:hypothetical protein